MFKQKKDYEETFELNGEQIKTTVIVTDYHVERHISSFLCPSTNHQTKVMGFDVEWYLINSNSGPSYTKSKCATIQLCDGHSCLIIQLNHLYPFQDWTSSSVSVYRSLVNFLGQPNFTFVGVGIEGHLAKLEKFYGIGCRNAVELGPLAATVMGIPRLSYCGVDELAYVVNGFDLGVHRPVTMSYDYSVYPLSKELVKLATVNVYSYYKIGSTLLHSM